MVRRRQVFAIAVGAVTLLGLGAGTASAAVSAAAGPTWTSVFPYGIHQDVTAVTTVMYGSGKTAEFAFTDNGDHPLMYSRSDNESWGLDSVTGAKSHEAVVSAKAIGPNQVLLFTQINGGSGGGRVIEYTAIREQTPGGYVTGAKFTVLKTFSAGIGSASVLSASNVWVFGSAAAGAGGLGVWHYNGKTWTQVSKTFTNGSAVSSTSVWAASGTTLERYNGSKWAATSIAGLLSSKNATVSTIFTGGADSPYAIVSENAKAAGGGGPVVVLEYNGHAWVKVASYAAGSAVPGAAAADGAAGLWFSVIEGPNKPARLLHFENAHHTLTAVAVSGLTTNAAGSEVSSVAQIGGSTKELIGADIDHTTSTPTASVYYLG
jgi:hypothetical protein